MRKTHLAGCIAASLAAAGPATAGVQHAELQEVTITSTPISGALSSTAQSATVLRGDALALRLASTIGETVAAEPGVHSTYFGPGASRPVIRGLGGDRVLVLTDGLPTLDASGLSEDHAVAIDPALADQVEVVRGPASLLYGTGASGGIVNVVTNRIHESLPEAPEGLLELRGDTAHAERAVAGRLDAGAGPLALHVDGVWRETDDYDIPGYAQSRVLREALEADGEEVEDTRGVVPNSWTETRSGGVGVTYVAEEWLLGAAYSRHDTRYGIPGGHGHGHEEEGGEHEEEGHEEGGPVIDLVQDRVDMAFRRDFGDERRLRIDAAANAYEHAELEPSGDVGTLYEVDGRELRLAYDHRLPWDFTGTAGLQWQQVELAATGEEAFIPDSRTRTLGAFLFEQRDYEAWSLELGARLDRQEVEAAGLAGYDDTALNVSVGAIVPLGGSLSLVGQLARIERHPSSTELYADGPHAATGQYEVGNPGFGTEKGLQAEAGLRYEEAGRAAELRFFLADYDGYLFLSPTGEVEDELPVFQYLQQDARFYGVEALASLPLADEWTLGLFADAVRGKLDAGGNLPRMPPLRVGAELAYERGGWRAAVSARHTFEQDRIAEQELPTDSYTMLDAELLWRPGGRADGTMVFLRATNLLDEEARIHSSPLKDEVPLPGRSLSVGLRYSFGD
jgi:iron complex outermembrane receptor protein